MAWALHSVVQVVNEDGLMADEDMIGNGIGAAVSANGNGFIKILMAVAAVIVLSAVSIVATLYVTGAMTGYRGGSVEATQAVSNHGPASRQDSFREPIYYAFDPAFVVNFNDGKNIRYLQLTMEVMTYDDSVVEDLKKHMPVIRNNLIMILSNLNYEVINTVAGKKKLQDEALSEIKSILKEKTGREGVEEVYFTGFVMQ